MRTSKVPAFFVLSASSAAVVLAVACGGGATPDAKDPNAAASATPASDPASGPAKPEGDTQSAAAGGSTTTTQLGDAGDLQGAKLGSSSKKEIEIKGDAGPKTPPGGKSDEPGRRIDDIATIVKTRRDDARACYDKALKDHPGIEGDLNIKWTIDTQGNVTDISVNHQKSNIHEDSVGNCVIEIIKKIKFAPSAKGYETHASYPFNFHPKNTPGAAKDAGK